MATQYEFDVTYDSDSIHAARRTVFARAVGWQSLVVVVGAAIGTGSLIYIGQLSSIQEYLLLCVPVLLALGYVYFYWSMSRRMARSLVGTYRFRLEDEELCVSSEAGTGSIPWKTFSFAIRDDGNLLLFPSIIAAIVIPTEDVPEAAVSFVLARVEERQLFKWL